MSMAQKQHLPLLRFLFIEDAEDDALLLIDYFESQGFRFDWQRVDTEKGVIAALQKPWDIIFSDYSMPGFSGVRALEIVRQRDPDIPFIFISGAIGEDVAVEAMKLGAQDYVMKGNLGRLLPAVNRELQETKKRREHRQFNQLLRKLSQAVNQAADSIFITDPAGRIEYVNPAFEKLSGYSAEEVKGKTPAFLYSGLHDNNFYLQLWQAISNGHTYQATFVNRHKNGELFYEEQIITPLKDEQGNITHFVSTGRDITSRIKAEEERTRLTAILNATPDLVAIFEPEGRLRYLNESGRRLLELGVEKDVSRYTIQELFATDKNQQSFAEVLAIAQQQGIWSGETLLQIPRNKELPVSQVVLAHKESNDSIEYLSTIARDITERKRFEAELQHQATHDRLTSLPNRFLLLEHFSSALKNAQRHNYNIAVLFMDLDNFKRINDSLGHTAGDILLEQIAQRLQSCMRANDTVARHGGDEFTIVLNELKEPENILDVLNKLYNAFKHPVIIHNHDVYVTFSIGIALYPHDGDRIEDLLRHADIAMYRAKSMGPNQYCFYASDMNIRGHELLALEGDLRRALVQNEFVLHYQPQIDLRNNRVIGTEGLIRWQHPVRGLVSPADFIPLLERSGMIISVGEWVLHQACKAHRDWRAAGFNDIRVSVNVSATQFNDIDLLDKIRYALREEDMPKHALELEITENILMRDPAGATEVLESINGLGVRIAVDDFGTGYSSLAYLKRFPLDALKIDQTFMTDLTDYSGDAAIVEASISLAHKLDMEVTAEGVETNTQLEFLRTHDCDVVQGYYFCRPLPMPELTNVLHEKTK
ncbi:EAL domain-containing protein [Nitrosomonas communis]|uniref:PAS domain S-box-containing protein/diguanylate cyclase (GGDEF) domain-containing protein n=1 Tax=Nitrosomonas communis TaxID=44574 RepID=A0A1I4K4C2_9PROT|nr:EAL domain-containing protein [Nitrosomonas communis]SFL73316.1 PAS domain S-box-containing protein/diguanylate cyclase (GGDEF) domain-containing protein [Nitrosomonas communis]